MRLEALKPAIAVTGHGGPMSGVLLRESLQKLASNFDQIAVPDYGRYVNKDAPLPQFNPEY